MAVHYQSRDSQVAHKTGRMTIDFSVNLWNEHPPREHAAKNGKRELELMVFRTHGLFSLNKAPSERAPWGGVGEARQSLPPNASGRDWCRWRPLVVRRYQMVGSIERARHHFSRCMYTPRWKLKWDSCSKWLNRLDRKMGVGIGRRHCAVTRRIPMPSDYSPRVESLMPIAHQAAEERKLRLIEEKIWIRPTN